jgi:transposase
MAELGVIAPQGISRVADLVAVILGEDETRLPALARQARRALVEELESLGNRVEALEAAILAWHKENEASRRLATIPGIGPRYRTDHRLGDGRQHHWPHAVPFRPTSCCLDRLGAGAERQRR